MVEARKTAWRVADSFSRKHGIEITSEKQAGFSEHTVENKQLDGLIRPIVVEEPILAKERLDLSINHTSHKDKVEWTGKTAKERVIAFEHLLDDPITKSDFVQFREELLEAFRDLLPPKTPPKNYIGRDYG